MHSRYKLLELPFIICHYYCESMQKRPWLLGPHQKVVEAIMKRRKCCWARKIGVSLLVVAHNTMPKKMPPHRKENYEKLIRVCCVERS